MVAFGTGMTAAISSCPKQEPASGVPNYQPTKKRDEINNFRLEELGWRVLVVHECDLRDSPNETLAKLANAIRHYGN